MSPAYVEVAFRARADPSATHPRDAHVAKGSAAPEVALALAVVLLAETVDDADEVIVPDMVLLAAPDAVDAALVEATVLETADVVGLGAVAASTVAL